MRITKVYTRTGDRGQTSLVAGRRVAKDDIRIESYGTVDELNAILGLVRIWNQQTSTQEIQQSIDQKLALIQNELFDVGADLATAPEDRWEGMHRVGAKEIERLELWCDTLNADLEPLREFILPGGGIVGAFLHQARTVCRRAERQIVTLIREQPETGEGCLVYLNRLSDFLFVLARWSAKQNKALEFSWQKAQFRSAD